MSQEQEILQHIQALDSNDFIQRMEASAKLINIGTAAVKPLIQAVKANEGLKASRSAEILGEMKSDEALPVLRQALREQDPLLGSAAVKGLCYYKREDVWRDLVDALPDAHIMTRMSILVAIQELKERRAVPYLVEYLPQPRFDNIRTLIIKTLNKLGDPRAIPALEPYIDDDDHHVREWVQITLTNLRKDSENNANSDQESAR